MKVILLLAGRGSRFLPLSETVPKPLIPVAGEPVLAHILKSLSPLDIGELVVITSHLSANIEAYLSRHYHGPFRCIRQQKLDGTGGAVHAARETIDQPVLVVYGDTIFDADLSCLADKPDVNVIWTRTVDDFQRFGIVQADSLGNMQVIVEKPRVDVGRKANIGLFYLADHRALRESLERTCRGPAINGEYYFTYALNDMVKHGSTITMAEIARWLDCGTLTALIDTNQHLLAENQTPVSQYPPRLKIIPPVLIQNGVELHDCEIGPNVTIESGCRITSSKLAHALIGKDCLIHDVVLSGSLVAAGERLTGQTFEGCIVAHGKTTKVA